MRTRIGLQDPAAGGEIILIFSFCRYCKIKVIGAVCAWMKGIFIQYARAAAAVAETHVGGVEVHVHIFPRSQFVAVASL